MTLSLINRGQIRLQVQHRSRRRGQHQARSPRAPFQTLQAKKQEKIVHPYLQEEVEIGLLPISKPCCWRGTCAAISPNTHRFLCAKGYLKC